MTSIHELELLERIRERMHFLYGDDAERYVNRLQMLIGRYEVGPAESGNGVCWTEKDTLLITYGDSVIREHELPLETLRSFMDEQLEGIISGVHILPFFPFSSDDGFSVIDYRQVRGELGGWWNIRALAETYHVMADLVINHVSAKSSWFADYKNAVAPASGFFIEADPGQTELSMVTRPRTSPLLTPVETINGTRHVWSTFSNDQIDLDFSNPDVLFEMLDIILFYISNGVSTIRLDAIAYLWKKIGTSCIHLDETHEVVKLIRDFLLLTAPHVTIITETNVPHEENVSYFGDGDEAHMIYQFSLPPLVLHALLFGNAEHLTRWASELENPPDGCFYFNFLSSHDGIGVRPIEGLIPDAEFRTLIDTVVDSGGYVSYKENSDGSLSPYELNITYFSALVNESAEGDERDLQIRRFLCAHTIMMSLQGVPAFYIHSLLACKNDEMGVQSRGYYRAINRRQWGHAELQNLLESDVSDQRKVLEAILNLIQVRSQQPAFHPEAIQKVYHLSDALFAFSRISERSGQHILCISNLSRHEQVADLGKSDLKLDDQASLNDLITGTMTETDEGAFTIKPYETKWLVI